MNLHINKLGAKHYQAVLQHSSGLEILGPSRDIFTPEAAVEALADMVRGWTDEIPATLNQHKGWLGIAAALKASVALSNADRPSENPDPNAAV